MTNNSDHADAARNWNRRFEADGYVFGTEPNEWLRGQAGKIVPRGQVLCVADGEGRNSVWLAGRGYKVDAFDIASAGLDKARALAKQARVDVNYTLADCERFAWPSATYDAVAAIFVQFAGPALRPRLFAWMKDALKPGGILILAGYGPRQLDYRTGGPSDPSHLYTEALIRDAFADFDILELREYEAELREGCGHNGRSALVGLVARRPGA